MENKVDKRLGDTSESPITRVDYILLIMNGFFL